MSQTKRFVLLAGAALSLGGVNAALAQQAQSPDEVRAIVSEMLADAQNRTSLLAAGGAGYEGGQFYLADASGNNRLNIGGLLQFRYLIDFNDDSGTLPRDDFQPGFQTARTEIWFQGNIINPNWTFRVNGDFDRDGGSFILEDAWINYKWSNGFGLKMGQFKLPFLREELVADQYQLAVDRSMVDETFNQDWAQGVQLTYEAKDWHVAGAFSDGFASRNTDFTVGGGGSPTEADYAFTGRFEYLFSGNWEEFNDFTAMPGQKFGAMAGAAFHYQESANSPSPADVDVSYISYTADVSLEGDAWGLYAAFVGSHSEMRGPIGTTTTPDFDDFGLVVQGSYRFSSNTEIFARYDGIFADKDRFATGDENFNFLTVGLNQYYAGHAAKATVDLVWSLNETTNLVGFTPVATGVPFANGSGLPNTGVGMLGDSSTGEVVVRFQFQLMF